MLSTKKLVYQYPRGPEISFPDLAVAVNEPLLILGESGSGKTTLLHLLAGLLRPTSGEVLIDGVDLGKLSASKADRFRGEHIGLVYQRAYFLEALSIRENLQLSPFAPSKSEALATAERLGIAHLLNKKPRQLSVGEQQRATIARALVNHPKVILADEPTSALDSKNCERVAELLLEQSKAFNAALIVVTHDDRLRKFISRKVELPALNVTPV